MASTTLDRRVSVLLVNNIIVVCALICVTFYTVSMNLKLTDSLRNLESKVQDFKAKDNVKTAETRQKFEDLGREILKTRQRRSIDLWKIAGIPTHTSNNTLRVPVLLMGSPGPRGPPGQTGNKGQKGSLGVPGTKGVKGKHGRRGKRGPMGIKGDPGNIGMPGPRGTDGKSVPKGAKGEKGERGLTRGNQIVVSPGTAGTATFSCGEIKCVAKSVLGEDRKKADLTILVKTKAIIQKKKIETEEGQNIKIRCEVKGNPEPTITWHKTDSQLPTRANFTDNNKVLEIVNAKIADSGKYICKAVNNLAKSRSATTVSVSKRLVFANRQRGTLTANEKKNITLTCMYKDGLSPVSTVWTKDGVRINLNNKARFSINNQVMELRDLEMGDAGNYTCIIKSQVSQIQNTVQLIVRKLHPNTCNEIRKSGFLKSGSYVISSTGNPSQLLHVYCDMDSKPGGSIAVFTTCSDMRKSGKLISDWYRIYPTGDPTKSVSVYCDMDSKPGEGITVLFKTCSDIRKSGQMESGSYQIYPTGDSSKSVGVYCDMDSKPGEGITVISHDSEAKTRVQGTNPGSYKKGIVYEISPPEIKAIIESSKKCQQFIKYECFGSYLTASDNGIYDPATWWVSAAGQKMTNWGGADHTVRGCACSLTNSRAGGNTCNCNKNDGVWREDSGYLDEKEFLPVKELWFGDLDHPIEDSYYTLGNLKCH